MAELNTRNKISNTKGNFEIDNRELVNAICIMVGQMQNSNSLKRIYNVVSRLFIKED